MSKKIAFLDGLRGVAAVIVVIDHWWLMGYQDPTSNSSSIFWDPWFLLSPLRLLIAGGYAVSIFFILSGYVLLSKFFRDPLNLNHYEVITSSILRRYPRLLIPSFFSLLMYYSWLHFGPYQGFSGCHFVGDLKNYNLYGTRDGFALSISFSDVILNGLIGQWTYQPAIYSIQWTLQIELIGSFLIFSMALAISYFSYLKNPKFRLIMYITSFIFIPVLYGIGRESTCPYFLQYIWTFIIGMFFADIGAQGFFQKITNQRKSHPILFFTFQVFLLILSLYLGTFPRPQTYPYTQIYSADVSNTFWLPLSWGSPWLCLTAGATTLFLSLMTFKEFQDLLSTYFCKELGRLSFSIYLLHYQILILADVLIMPYLGPLMSPSNVYPPDRSASAFIVLIFVITPCVYFSSCAFYIYCDKVSVYIAQDVYNFFISRFPVYCQCLKKRKEDQTSLPKMSTVKDCTDNPMLSKEEEHIFPVVLTPNIDEDKDSNKRLSLNIDGIEMTNISKGIGDIEAAGELTSKSTVAIEYDGNTSSLSEIPIVVIQSDIDIPNNEDRNVSANADICVTVPAPLKVEDKKAASLTGNSTDRKRFLLFVVLVLVIISAVPSQKDFSHCFPPLS